MHTHIHTYHTPITLSHIVPLPISRHLAISSPFSSSVLFHHPTTQRIDAEDSRNGGLPPNPRSKQRASGRKCKLLGTKKDGGYIEHYLTYFQKEKNKHKDFRSRLLIITNYLYREKKKHCSSTGTPGTKDRETRASRYDGRKGGFAEGQTPECNGDRC